MILCMLILLSSLVPANFGIWIEEDSRMELTTSGDTTIPEGGTAFLSVTGDNSWKLCTWTRSDGIACVFDYHSDDCSSEQESVSEKCGLFGNTEASFFGEYEETEENKVCGIKLEDVSYNSETTWTVQVRRCYDDSCCKARDHITNATLRVFLYEKPNNISGISLASPTIGENGEVSPGSTHSVTCQVGGGGDAGWVKPEPELTWMLGNETFQGELDDPIVTKQPGVLNNSPGLKVEQTAHLFVEDSLENVDFTCRSTVYNSSKKGEELFHNEATISLSVAGCPLPLPLSLSSPAWGCNGTISGAKVGNHVSCTYRCGQGGLAGLAQCKGTDWVPQISTVLDCHYNDTEVFNFFDAEDQDSFTNPPEDSFFDPSSMLFTSPQYGLYLFGITAASNDVTLQTQTGVLANMHSDSGTSSSLVITLLKQEDTIQASYQDSEGLHFLGTSLHSLGGSVPYVSGTASGHLGVEDAPQNIIMTEYSQNGEHLTYDESSGCIQVMEEGDYLMGLTLSSKGSSIASLKVDDVTLGLGDDTQGQGMMSNSAIMHLNEGACIVPQLEPLSQIYEGDKWSQLFLTSIPAGGSGDAFCYALSQPIFNEYPKQVSFDVPLLSNPHFNSGIFSIPDYEEFNPRRFYLVLVNAFMASGTLTLELGDSQGNWEAVGKGHTATTDRRMVTVRKIVEMDNFKNMIRIKASGLLDEGDSHFATFCGMRIGK